tara:strand:+ start:902 stop:1723 length:822 start_codon:yes stop_codon:yes gene_type:complete
MMGSGKRNDEAQNMLPLRDNMGQKLNTVEAARVKFLNGQADKVCGIKFSYVVSSCLHRKGIADFWSGGHVRMVDQVAVLCDLLLHLALWIIPLIMEIWGNYLQGARGNKGLQEIQSSSLFCLICAFAGILIAQVFAMISGGQEAGKLFPTTYGAIVGGAYASIAFSVVWMTYWMSAHSDMLAQSMLAEEHELNRLRHTIMWSTVLKFIAVQTLVKNADFWGYATTDNTSATLDQAVAILKVSTVPPGKEGELAMILKSTGKDTGMNMRVFNGV